MTNKMMCPNPECGVPLSFHVFLTDELLEKLAELEHRQWAHWIKFEHSRNLYVRRKEELKKWFAQAETPYNQLSEVEKESDREWARKVLDLLIGANFIACEECGTVVYRSAEK